MRVAVLTPTADQPTGMALAEKFMARQTLQPDQWIVVDDGVQHANLTIGQSHIWREREADCKPAQSLCRNLLAGIALVDADVIVIWEHDDFVATTHLEMIVGQLEHASIAGDPLQRYYNVAHRCWRIFNNVGASLCQTAFRRSLLPYFKSVVTTCLQNGLHYVDRKTWDGIPDGQKSLKETNTVVGIKGLPGRPGIGVGHRPTGSLWREDGDLAKLKEWIGDDDSMLYEPFAQIEAVA